MIPPEVQHIAITFADDTVGVMAFVTTEYDVAGNVRWTRMATKENVEDEISRSFFPDKEEVVSWKFVDAKDIPEDRTFRDALRHGPRKGFFYDIAHAREIHRDHMREVRGSELAKLDIEYQRADEAGDDKAKQDIAALKQKLRDVTDDPKITAAKTTDELKKVWPKELPKWEG